MLTIAQTLLLAIAIGLLIYVILKRGTEYKELVDNHNKTLDSMSNTLDAIEESIEELDESIDLSCEKAERLETLERVFKYIPEKTKKEIENRIKKENAKQIVAQEVVFKNLMSFNPKFVPIEKAIELYMEEYIANKKAKEKEAKSKTKTK